MVLHCEYVLCPLIQLNSVFSGRVDALLHVGLLAQHFYHKGLLWVHFDKEIAFCISETLFGSMTPVQLSVTAFNTDPSNVCSCVQEPGLLKPSKEQRMHLGKHSRRSTVGQGQRDLPNADRGGCSSCHKSASSWISLAMVYWFMVDLAGAFCRKISGFRQKICKYACHSQ